MRRDVQEIFRLTPHEKQCMMFSATLSKEIRPVCRKFMQDVSRAVAKTTVQQLWPFWVLGPKLTLLRDTHSTMLRGCGAHLPSSVLSVWELSLVQT